jgi:predicted ATPase
VNVSANGVDSFQVGRLWDTVALTPFEDDVVDALRIIAPGVERISLIGDRPVERSVVVKMPGFGRPIPLRSMGDGMSRMLGIALSLVSARDGVLLVDEIENGIHYSVQSELWELVFRTARRLNVQVFASTHSWDCIEAFQAAAQADPYEEAALIRLEQSAEGVRTTIFSEHELAVAARRHIEVR